MAATRFGIGTWNLLTKHFSLERMKQYLSATDQNHSLAVELFTWNSSTCASLWELIGYVEIALRSRVDFQLRAVNRMENWLLTDKVFGLDDPIWTVIRQAQARVGLKNVAMTHDQVLQQLPLGFFQTVLSKRYMRLWPMLAEGFIGGSRNSQRELSALMVHLRKFRNRVGHHDLLVDVDLQTEFENLMRIAELLDPNLMRWLRAVTSIEKLIQARPVRLNY